MPFVDPVNPSLAVALLLVASFAQAAPSKPGKVAVELVVDDARVARGAPTPGPIRVGLRMTMDPGWHTYWKNPGDAGMPTQVRWALPPGWSGGGIEWPAPERIPVGRLASYGYEGEVVLPMLLFPPRDWDGSPVRFDARAEWLVCKESCLPEAATLSLAWPAAIDAKDRQRVRALFDDAQRRQPHAMRWDRASVERVDGRLELALAPAQDGTFFPDAEELVEPGDAPRVRRAGPGVTWSAALGIRGRQLAPGTPIRGVWVPASGKPLLVDAVLER